MNIVPDYSNIPRELKELNQWICVSSDSKVPMRAWENEAASSTDATTWTNFTEALMYMLI